MAGHGQNAGRRTAQQRTARALARATVLGGVRHDYVRARTLIVCNKYRMGLGAGIIRTDAVPGRSFSKNRIARFDNADPLGDVHPNVRFVFRRTAEIVAVRYFDKQRCFRFRRQPRGFTYLHTLLQNPGKELTLLDILGSPLEDREERYTKYESLWVRAYDDHGEETEAFRPQEGFAPQALADFESLKNVDQRKSELRREYRKAKQQVDYAAQMRISRELNELSKYKRDVRVPGSGRLRTFRDSQTRAIRRDLIRTYQALEENGMRTLANHFRRYVEVSGCRMIYRPPAGLKWHF